MLPTSTYATAAGEEFPNLHERPFYFSFPSSQASPQLEGDKPFLFILPPPSPLLESPYEKKKALDVDKVAINLLVEVLFLSGPLPSNAKQDDLESDERLGRCKAPYCTQ